MGRRLVPQSTLDRRMLRKDLRFQADARRTAREQDAAHAAFRQRTAPGTGYFGCQVPTLPVVARALALQVVPAPRYTVESRGEYWAVLDSQGHLHGLPAVYETFRQVAAALVCAHALNVGLR
jgi:hypothetical protein